VVGCGVCVVQDEWRWVGRHKTGRGREEKDNGGIGNKGGGK
jgi:hypothetical protein